MKKKRILSSLLMASVLVGGVVLSSGCTLFDDLLITTGWGTPYDVAVKEGTNLSEGAWLAEVVGADNSSFIRQAYEEAKTAGYTGTYLDFITSYLTVTTDDSSAVNRMLTSVVSIQCNFTVVKRELVSGGFYPIYQNRETTATMAGAGVIYSLSKSNGDAYVVTNYHVVYYDDSRGNETIPHISDDINLFLYGGEVSNSAIKATFVGGAMDYDIAVLKVSGSDVLKESSSTEAMIGRSTAVTVGERVYAVGNPGGYGLAATMGIVSSDSEYITIAASDDKHDLSLREIRTDASINSGNSGGGLFTANGQLVGIVNAKSVKTGVEGMGYAIPSDMAIGIVRNIIDNSDRRGAFIAKGVTVGLGESHGVFDVNTQKVYIEETVVVSEVTLTSAFFGKLQVNDVIYSVKLGEQETFITRTFMLDDFLLGVRKGDTITVKVKRGATIVSVDVTFDKDSQFELFN